MCMLENHKAIFLTDELREWHISGLILPYLLKFYEKYDTNVDRFIMDIHQYVRV